MCLLMSALPQREGPQQKGSIQVCIGVGVAQPLRDLRIQSLVLKANSDAVWLCCCEELCENRLGGAFPRAPLLLRGSGFAQPLAPGAWLDYFAVVLVAVHGFC